MCKTLTVFQRSTNAAYTHTHTHKHTHTQIHTHTHEHTHTHTRTHARAHVHTRHRHHASAQSAGTWVPPRPPASRLLLPGRRMSCRMWLSTGDRISRLPMRLARSRHSFELAALRVHARTPRPIMHRAAAMVPRPISPRYSRRPPTAVKLTVQLQSSTYHCRRAGTHHCAGPHSTTGAIHQH